MHSALDISIAVPVFNEEESVAELSRWIEQVMTSNNYSYELLLVDDGSSDGTWNEISRLAAGNTSVKGIRFRRNYGKSAALNTAFEISRGNVVFTMDGDLQDSPDEIPELYRMILDDGYDLVSGWKKKRYDPISKTLPTKLFNWATRKMSGISLHDFNCGLKAYRGDLARSIEVYGEMHRYIPVIAKWAGFGKIGEKAVKHQKRKYGKTKFGMERFINGFLDLLSIAFVSRFGKKPMHLFGLLGTLMFIIGFLFSLSIGIDKLFIDTTARLITERPSFYIALAAMIIGVQLFLAGFLAELVSRNSPNRNKYEVSERINIG